MRHAARGLRTVIAEGVLVREVERRPVIGHGERGGHNGRPCRSVLAVDRIDPRDDERIDRGERKVRQIPFRNTERGRENAA